MYINYLKIFCKSKLLLLLHSFMYSIIYFNAMDLCIFVIL